MPAPFLIKRAQCSKLGIAILDYMEANNMSMNEMAERAGITQPGLRSCCWHLANPTEDTLTKLSKILRIPYKELQMWVFEDRIEYGYKKGASVGLLIAIEHMIELLRGISNNYSEGQRPSEYELMHEAFSNVLSCALGKKRHIIRLEKKETG